MKPPSILVSGAEFSGDQEHRYRLWRVWDMSLPSVVWIMLNPSVAGARQNDQTISVCIGFSATNGFGGLIVANLFSFITPSPAELKLQGDRVNRVHSDRAIRRAVIDPLTVADSGQPRHVITAWGDDGTHRGRADEVIGTLRVQNVELYHLGRTKSGQPRHPLRLGYDTPLQRWEAA